MNFDKPAVWSFLVLIRRSLLSCFIDNLKDSGRWSELTFLGNNENALIYFKVSGLANKISTTLFPFGLKQVNALVSFLNIFLPFIVVFVMPLKVQMREVFDIFIWEVVYQIWSSCVQITRKNHVTPASLFDYFFIKVLLQSLLISSSALTNTAYKVRN